MCYNLIGSKKTITNLKRKVRKKNFPSNGNTLLSRSVTSSPWSYPTTLLQNKTSDGIYCVLL